MIKENELRIGNYVTIDNKQSHPTISGQMGLVIGILERYEKLFPKSTASISIQIGDNSFSQFNEYIEPIPLTEEWLVKLGFELFQDENDAFPSYHHKYSFVLDEKFQPSDVGFPIAHIEFKYVHQLQNLYFALTGEELTIKS